MVLLLFGWINTISQTYFYHKYLSIILTIVIIFISSIILSVRIIININSVDIIINIIKDWYCTFLMILFPLLVVVLTILLLIVLIVMLVLTIWLVLLHYHYYITTVFKVILCSS